MHTRSVGQGGFFSSFIGSQSSSSRGFIILMNRFEPSAVIFGQRRLLRRGPEDRGGSVCMMLTSVVSPEYNVIEPRELRGLFVYKEVQA